MSYREGFLYLFESIEMPGWYYMKGHGKEGGDDWYHRFNRTGRWDETDLDADAKKAGGYGMPRIKVKYPVGVEVNPHSICWQFEMFIKENKVTDIKQIVDSQNADNIWYAFKEKIDLQKWLQEFLTRRNKELREAAIKENAGKQTAFDFSGNS
ncbi:MAG: hypothetical protein SFU87_17195 [Chitinophagaceae bacterium]|nr:hypothetical protein [Chitinophagaceae bacterium]